MHRTSFTAGEICGGGLIAVGLILTIRSQQQLADAHQSMQHVSIGSDSSDFSESEKPVIGRFNETFAFPFKDSDESNHMLSAIELDQAIGGCKT